MKKQEKLNRIQMAKVAPAGFRAVSDTSCPSGSFDTSAPLDAQAAIIRNRSWSSGPGLRTWDSDQAAAPEKIQAVSFQAAE
jgi:hypothetical protein